MSEQRNLVCLNNQNLFSSNYLEHHLPLISLWQEQKGKAANVFEEIKKLYETIRTLELGPGEEAELEDKFIQPALSALGHVYHVQPVTKRGFKKKRPDYALFQDYNSYKLARKYKEAPKKFFSHALTIVEAKHWKRRLNDADKNDILDSRDPTAQTVKYLEDVHLHTNGTINWAILTNGKLWRLFYYKAASRSGNFFEVDIEEIINRDSIDDFLYFYLFFSKDAFIIDPVSGTTWLDQHLRGSEDYAARVSTKLKDLIFDDVFEGLAAGFVHYRKTELSIKTESEESKKETFKGCLTLLYRLLFLLYAESRNLLPIDERGYFNVSLSKLKQDIYQDLLQLGHDKMSKRSYTYWARLEGLFDIIAEGDPALNVPVYNGGLFETPDDSFLKNHKLADPYLAEAVELLTVDHGADYPPATIPYIDYSSLSVRHLGDIYEGLLEFHIQIADETIAEIKDKGKFLWKKLSELKSGAKTYREKAKGEVYIENSKHERKATGSYYTPHYIVEYIVENTVAPVLDEKLNSVKNLIPKIEDMNKALRRQKSTAGIKGYRIRIKELEDAIFNTVFDCKVLDPAMGSGHFLVHTVDFITDRIISFLTDYPENPVIRKINELRNEILDDIKRQGVQIDESKLTEINLIKRLVMKRCIYGVDLNDMAVELAKLSLWLDSFTLGAPLSFLDHHLKCGHSLIGAKIEDLENALVGHLFAINLEPLKRAIRNMLFISDLPDATLMQVRESYKKYGEACLGLRGYKLLLDMLVSGHFGIPDAKKMLLSDFDKIDLENLNKSIKKLPNKDRDIISNIEKLTEEKRFFHWEIEFPEVFYEQTSEFGQKIDKKVNSGFDCVIGNPPYGLLDKDSYFRDSYVFINPNNDIYIAFMEKGLSLASADRYVSYIVPVSWETGAMFEKMREVLLEHTSLKAIINLPFNVFKDAYIDTCIFVIQRQENLSNKTLVYEFPQKAKIEKLDTPKCSDIEQALWLNNKHQIILNFHVVSLIPKLFQNSSKLSVITSSIRGILPRLEFVSSDNKEGFFPFFDGEMFRYEVSSPNKFIHYSDELPEKPSDVSVFKGHRILVRRLISRQDRLMATCVKDFFVNKKDIYIFKNIDKNYSPYYLLTLINSKLLSYIYINQEIASKKDDFRQATLEGLRNLPIRNISFKTPVKQRDIIVRKLVDHYISNKLETIRLEADTYLPRDNKGNLLIEKEKSDVIHDLLVYIAEQIIEMNKEKNKEVNGFLKWLEHEIGRKIDGLIGKTLLKNYHDNDFAAFLAVLKKNKQKLCIDPTNRKVQETLEKYFDESMAVLLPLKNKIKATDNLIDQIVYKLYGLPDEEIRIVEEKG